MKEIHIPQILGLVFNVVFFVSLGVLLSEDKHALVSGYGLFEAANF